MQNCPAKGKTIINIYKYNNFSVFQFDKEFLGQSHPIEVIFQFVNLTIFGPFFVTKTHHQHKRRFSILSGAGVMTAGGGRMDNDVLNDNIGLNVGGGGKGVPALVTLLNRLQKYIGEGVTSRLTARAAITEPHHKKHLFKSGGEGSSSSSSSSSSAAASFSHFPREEFEYHSFVLEFAELSTKNLELAIKIVLDWLPSGSHHHSCTTVSDATDQAKQLQAFSQSDPYTPLSYDYFILTHCRDLVELSSSWEVLEMVVLLVMSDLIASSFGKLSPTKISSSLTEALTSTAFSSFPLPDPKSPQNSLIFASLHPLLAAQWSAVISFLIVANKSGADSAIIKAMATIDPPQALTALRSLRMTEGGNEETDELLVRKLHEILMTKKHKSIRALVVDIIRSVVLSSEFSTERMGSALSDVYSYLQVSFFFFFFFFCFFVFSFLSFLVR